LGSPHDLFKTASSRRIVNGSSFLHFASALAATHETVTATSVLDRIGTPPQALEVESTCRLVVARSGMSARCGPIIPRPTSSILIKKSHCARGRRSRVPTKNRAGGPQEAADARMATRAVLDHPKDGEAAGDHTRQYERGSDSCARDDVDRPPGVKRATSPLLPARDKNNSLVCATNAAGYGAVAGRR
jgi:hypothetical protein